jgi:cholest-4-en-3-one 26-monooxygenase
VLRESEISAPRDWPDLTDVDMFLRGEHWEAFRVLRNHDPVHWQDRSWGPGIWHVTKYADVVRVGVDPETFISGQGIIMDNTSRPSERRQRMAEEGGAGNFDPHGQMMIMSDPPRHTVMRRFVNHAFTRKSVLRMEPHIRDLVTRILDDVVERGECDFVMDISRLLPLEVICELVGVPEGDWEAMFELSNRILGFDDPEFRPETDEISPEDVALSLDLFSYMQELAEDRKQNPREDVLSTLVNGEVDGERLNAGEIFMFFLLLIIAGNETTRNATTGGMLALIENPDQRQRLVDDPSLIPTAVEEIVRWTSPVMHFTRTATSDAQVGDVTVKEGQYVCLWYPSANRDEDVFTDGDVFDVGRKPNDHIAFGKGEHFCLGANLARIELRIMFEELIRRIPDMELAGPPERLRSNFINGIKRMPVRFTPSRPERR